MKTLCHIFALFGGFAIAAAQRPENNVSPVLEERYGKTMWDESSIFVAEDPDSNLQLFFG